MTPRGVRGSAETRREDVLRAAMTEFAVGGLQGTSTDTIARRAGISQPYLFRLYPGKKALFLAAVQRAFDLVDQVFRDAADSAGTGDVMAAMGEAYSALLADDHAFLQLQLQAYASSVEDQEVRALTRAAFTRLWTTVMTVGGLGEQEAQAFFAHGMLLNVTAAFGIAPGCGADDLLGRRLTAEPAAFAPRSA